MKKFVSLILSLVLVLSFVPTAFAAEYTSASDKFTDVPADAWYLKELEYAVFNGYISGTSSSTFSPDSVVTRGQFVTIIGRMFNVRLPLLFSDSHFVDVADNAYYAEYVYGMAHYGYVNGTSSTTFSPDAPITVEQMGTILSNFINVKLGLGAVWVGEYTASAEYTDALSISQWAKDSMENIRQYGFLVTDADGNVNPQKSVTRAECTVSLVRLAKAAGKGLIPVVIPKSITAEEAATRVHDALWSAGKLTSMMTQKEKALVYIEWLAATCSYDYDMTSPNRYNAYGALVGGKAVCAGYTKAYNLLLMTEGIECSTAETPDHMWTVATLDGVLYHIDSTNYGHQYDWDFMTPEEAWKRMTELQKEYDEAKNILNSGQ